MQQKFQCYNKNLKIFAKYQVDACTFDLSFYFVTINSTFDTASLCFFFIDKFIDKQQHFLYLMKVLIVLIPCVKAWQIHFVRIISLNKLHHNKASQIDVFTNKLDNLGNTTIIWVFWLIFILNQSCHQTHIAD